MTENIIQNMISQLGQSQKDRTPRELGVHFSDIDERTPADLLVLARRLAKFVNYYANNIVTPTGNWEPFFPFNEADARKLLEDEAGKTTPHLALLIAFCKLYERPREVINRITGQHLDFFYRRALQFTGKAAVPDRAHVLIELKKNAASISIGPENVFSAGKDDTGVELIYAPTAETVIGAAKVASLRSIHAGQSGHGIVRFAPIANSADGAGAELPKAEPKWYAFGHEDLPTARIGFAVASPVLRMREGTRKVKASLTLGNVDSAKVNNSALEGAFEIFVTGEKTWLGPYGPSSNIVGNVLSLEFDIAASETAVTDYNAAIHGYSYGAQAPVMQVLLKSGNPNFGYNDLKDLTVQKVKVYVEVNEVTSLVLESDGGALDPKKAFLPFGPQPAVGSRFIIGYSEALSKNLSEVSIKVQWKGAPSSFSTHYTNYGVTVSDGYFTASVSFADGGSWVEKKAGVKLFDPRTDSSVTLTFSPGGASTSPAVSEGAKVYALSTAGGEWALNAAIRQVQLNPVFARFRTVVPEPRPGFITLSLEKDFLHATYQVKYVENVMKYSKGQTATLVILNEPYTPTVQAISMSYKAHTDDVNIASPGLNDFASLDARFFHIRCFGQMREHRYQREQFGFVTDKNVSLLPKYDNEGEFLISLSSLKARDSVSILFQVAEGSADPELEQEDVQWFALCDNYWKLLGTSEVVRDTTNQLLTSGVITFVIPAEATAQNTIMPGGYLWLKAAIAENVKAVCQLIDVAANAVELEFTDNGNDPAHLSTALEAGRIKKLKTGLPAIKTAKQPYASFGGRSAESDMELNTRASERLRHKDRCITDWDYERVVLQEFPTVHKVKCIPHAKDGVWLSPGHVLIVVIPDLRNKNAIDPLQPRVDANTLSRIKAFLEMRVGMQVAVEVKNPRYQKIQLDFKVKFRTGYEFNFYSGVLKDDLTRFLSPWACETDRPLSFGGQVYKSVLLDFVEDLAYVDYVTDFKMYSYTGDFNDFADINEARPETPDAILVSDHNHLIAEAL